MPSDKAAAGTATGAAAGAAGERPILGTPDEFPPRPPRRGGFATYLVIALIVAVMAGGWGYVMMSASGNPLVKAQVISFDASAADSAEITFTVHKVADRAATCRLRALDTGHMEVGSRMIDVPSGKAELTFRERLRTSAQATAVYVDYCDLV
ncbi:DUF4307 domain-containing protein [Sphaerimonospora cavernae]|uniref:DUF4307 domain-containing protein n=1 Tax=Sphaerimonospora cavernae TaxID=1740611 RepID=A0ABV6U0K5_9ACTN